MTVRTYPQPRVPGESVAHLDLDALPNAPHWARSLTRSSLLSWRLWPEAGLRQSSMIMRWGRRSARRLALVTGIW